MTNSNSDFMAKLEAIKAEYAVDSLPTQIAGVQAQCAVLSKIDPTADFRDFAISLHGAAHKLTGSSGTFGFKEISEISRKICNLTENGRIDTTPFTAQDRDQVLIYGEQLQKLSDDVALEMGGV
jgi:HPt (histidine-containing phosphotransfer) domain-containing protein